MPQRRKRIALVADFGGLSAPEILFERKGVSGDSEPGKAPGKATAGSAESGADSAICIQGNCIDRADTARCNGKGWTEEVSYTLNTIDRPAVCAGFKHKASGMARGIGYEEEKAPSLIAGQESAVYDARGNGNGSTVPTLTGDHQNRVTDYAALCISGAVTPTLVASAYKGPGNTRDGFAVCVFDKEMYNCGEHMGGEPQTREDNVAPTCRADSHPSGVAYNGTVRRLTPLECERLQGYPDGWTDIGDWTDSTGKKHKAADSPRYKALGNSIALPFWQYLARRICAQYERDITMGSLFDGIGGFPLVFERCGAKAVWASEIEEFPIAVTKKHFLEAKA